MLFQYISCYGLSCSSFLKSSKSIVFQYVSCYGLSTRDVSINGWIIGFQYISCYGLSAQNDGQAVQFMYFNTSHVTVYQIYRIPFPVLKDISIHLMLRFIVKKTVEGAEKPHFNTSHVTVYLNSIINSKHTCHHFNTSHVTVYLRTRCSPFFAQLNFNTSHVTVYRKLFVAVKVWYPNFNTSHVTVYHQQSIFPVSRLAISIHLMLRFICFGLTIANSLS